MSERRPHLRIEQPLELSTRVYEGGGGGTYPRTSYATHARKIFAEAQQLKAIFASLSDVSTTDRRYFRVALPNDKTISTSTGASLADDLYSKLVGAPSDQIGHVSTTTASLGLLLDELQRYAAPGNVGKSKFAVLEHMGAIPLEEKVSAKAEALLRTAKTDADVLLGLFRDLSHVERQAIIQGIREWLTSKRAALTSVTEVETGTYLRVLAPADVVREVAQLFMSVQSVDPVEYVLDLSSSPGVALSQQLEVLPNASSAIAGIFDSGVVTGSRFLDGSIVQRESPLGTPYNQDHGTFVASRIIYGDTLRDQVAAGRLSPDVKVLSICTIVADDIGNKKPVSTEQMMRIVRETVTRWHTQIRVYNISQNLFPSDPSVDPTISNDFVSPLAAELDRLARRFGILFVVTAGNFPQPGAAFPIEQYPAHFATTLARIVPPAESVLALTVGSIAARANAGSLAPAGQPSPFTRKGPGFAKFRKPDLVAHGGNYGARWQEVDDLATAGIGDHGNHLCYGSGTSFAAPIVTRLAAKLFDAVPGATPELVRALLIHFADVVDEKSIPDLHHLVGNGHPDADRLLSSTQWAQTFVHVGALPYREMRRVAFYVPKGLCSRSGRRRVCVRVTVAYTPETDRTLKAGYCKSHVRCKLAKLDPQGRIKEIDANDGEAVVKARYAGLTRLEKTFSASVSGGEWVLLMEHVSRWSLKDEGMPIAAIITVEDPRRDPKVDVLAMIRNEVPNKYVTQLATPVALRV